MSDIAQPRSALGYLLKPGQSPRAGDGAAGLVIQEQPNVAQIQIIARKGQSASLARRLSSFLGIRKDITPLEGANNDSIHIYATGPTEYWVFSAKYNASALEKRFADVLGDAASLFDQTQGRFVVRISGDDATHLLAKGTPLDLDEGAFSCPWSEPYHGRTYSGANCSARNTSLL